MKKALAALALLGTSFALPPTVMAAEPIQWSGDVSLKYEKDTASDEDDRSGFISTFRLKAEAYLGSGWSLYSRLGAQHTSQAGLSDLNPDEYGEEKTFAIALDQFGVKYKTQDWLFNLGRQDVTIGSTALLYSRPDTNIGRRAFVDGLTINGAVRQWDLAVVAAREDNAAGFENNKLYAVHAERKLSERVSAGLTVGRYEAADNHTDHWALNSTYAYKGASLTGELAESNAGNANKAYALKLEKAINDKTTPYITWFRVEENASMGGQSDFDAGKRGIHYGITHTITDKDSLEIVYKDQKTIGSSNKDTALEVTYTRSF